MRMNLWQIFIDTVKKYPYELALIHNNNKWSYQELFKEVNWYIAYLLRQGVKPGDRIGILLKRDVSLITSLLAVLGCGGVYIPLNTQDPIQRISTILKDSNAKFLITDKLNYSSFCEKLMPPTSEKLDAVLKTIDINSNDQAYIIYTSGSTGTPKGVMISHDNACSLIDWVLTIYTRAELAFTLVATSISFDLFVFEMFAPISVGCCMVLVDNALSLIDNKLDQDITLINTVPSAITALLQANVIPSSVKTINLAGEALQQTLVKELYNKTSVTKVYNLYGPTETTTYSTYYLAEKNNDCIMVPIGHPIKGTQIYLLDKNQLPIPKLIPGEVYIGGLGVSQGYCNNVIENNSRFIELEIQGNFVKLFRTGDLAKFNQNQELEYLGRQDHQIKLRGFRIEPEEIAHILKQYHHIRQVFVIANSQTGQQRLIAYFIADIRVENSELSIWLSKYLPDYMVPSHFIQLEKFPLNNNGKIDRNQLPLPQEMKPKEMKVPIISNIPDQISQMLLKEWQSLLEKTNIDMYDNFFYTGGHSLLAARLQTRIHETFLVPFKLEEVFTFPTIAQQAELIKERQIQKNVKLESNIFKIFTRPKNIPLSYGQQRLWYLHYAEQETPISNIPIIIKLRGNVDLVALNQAFNGVIKRHEILRTTYHSKQHQLSQIIQDNFTFAIEVAQCSAEELDNLLIIAANKKFDLTKDLMIRANLYKLRDDESLLLVVQHHIASDAWSMNILMQELSVFYKAYHHHLPIPSLSIPVQYADYSCWQRRYFTEENFQCDVEFWKNKLENASDTIKLPYDKPRKNMQTYQGAFYQWELPRDLVTQLKKVAFQTESTLFVVLLSAFKMLLNRYSQQDDFCVGILSANRPSGQLDNTLGFFVNTLVTRDKIYSTMSVKELIKQVRITVLDALAHQQVPFDKLVELICPKRKLGHHPFFQVLFSLQNSLTSNLQFDNLEVSVSEYDRHIAKFDLTLSFIERDGILAGIFEYNTDLFYIETIERMVGHYIEILKSWCNQLDSFLYNIELLTLTEQKKWLVDFNQTQNHHSTNLNLVCAFQEIVRKFPTKIAIQAEGYQCTYEELDKYSTQLANYLIISGIKENSNVGLLLPRSPEIIISMLAVIKAGACYVPFDLTAPTERLKAIIEDANISLVLSMEGFNNKLASIINTTVILIDKITDIIGAQSNKLPIIHIEPHNHSYIIYTSGSTGKPKGVIANHEGVYRLVRNPNYVHLDEHQVILQISQLVFDGSTFDIWGTILNGGSLVLMPDGLPNLNTLAQLIQQYQVTTIFVTTHLFNTLVDYKLSSLGSLQQLLFGGDVASHYHVTKFKQAHPHCKLSNIYGPTECTTFAISYLIPDNYDTSISLPLGSPISDTSVVILSSHLNVMPVYVPGEIYIGGSRLAAGYLNQIELTQEKFIDNPIKEIESEKLYRTGDIGMYRADGQIVFIGRNDAQIKLRGYRIELSEIEHCLRDYQTIFDAVVIVQRPEEKLVAYILSSEKNIDVKDVQQFLIKFLPHYMVPEAIVQLNEFPLTSNGKIDKSKFPRYEITHAISAGKIILDEKMMQKLRIIWIKVLDEQNISDEDNFFEIGGNSLKMLHLLDCLQTHFADDEEILNKLEITTLFQYPSIVSLAAFLTNAETESIAPKNKSRIKRNRKEKTESIES